MRPKHARSHARTQPEALDLPPDRLFCGSRRARAGAQRTVIQYDRLIAVKDPSCYRLCQVSDREKCARSTGRQSPLRHGRPGPDAVIRAIDLSRRLAGFIAAFALAAMTVIVGYEVVLRSVFNSPTTWVTEISTYIFVGGGLLGLAEAQRANAHIKVEVLVDRLSTQDASFAELVGLWLGRSCCRYCLALARFTFLEYVHDARDWGLLGTPQWMPQLPSPWVHFVCCSFAPGHLPSSSAYVGARQWSVPVIAIGARRGPVQARSADLRIPGTRFDWGTVAICAAVTARYSPGAACALR